MSMDSAHGSQISRVDPGKSPPAFGGSLPENLIELRPVIENAFQGWLNKTESKATRPAYRNVVIQFLALRRHQRQGCSFSFRLRIH